MLMNRPIDIPNKTLIGGPTAMSHDTKSVNDGPKIPTKHVRFLPTACLQECVWDP